MPFNSMFWSSVRTSEIKKVLKRFGSMVHLVRDLPVTYVESSGIDLFDYETRLQFQFHKIPKFILDSSAVVDHYTVNIKT